MAATQGRGNVVLFTDPGAYAAWLATNQKSVHVAFFFAEFDAPSKPGGQMDAVVDKLAELHQRILFAKIDAEEAIDVAEQLDIAVVPTFVFVRDKVVIDRLEGANAAEFTRRVEKYAAQSVAEAAAKPLEPLKTNSDVERRLVSLINASQAMLFMKGSPEQPKCKFSRQMVDLLKEAKVAFGSFDILTDDAVRQGLKEYSNWPTYPQLYVAGKLVGGVDIVKELKDSGELAGIFPPPPPELVTSSGYSPGTGPLTAEVTARLQALMNKAPVVLFMKGTPEEPACGFSERMVKILQENQVQFAYHDILTDSTTRENLKVLSNWPTYPQLYVKGKLIGGLDVIKQMLEDGGPTLAAQLGVSQREPLVSRLVKLINAAHVMLFMKGNPASPACGFSAEAVQLLASAGVDPAKTAQALGTDGKPLFSSFDVLSDEELYVDGKLIGGVDIMKEMADAGELAQLVNIAGTGST